MHKPPGPSREVSAERFAKGRRLWNEYVGDALLQRNIAYGIAAGALCLAGYGMWQAREQHMRGQYIPIVVERDGMGRTASAHELASAGTGAMTDAAVRQRLLVWIRDCRTVYSDAAALRTAVRNCYALTKRGSAAWTRLLKFHNDDPPHERATRYTQTVQRDTALRDAGQAWRAEWTESRIGRDGQAGGAITYRMSASYVVEPPRTPEEIKENPEGWKVVDFDIEQVGPASPQQSAEVR